LLGVVGGEHSSVELTVSVKAPCQECGGRGYVETVTGGGRIVGDRTEECLTCSGRGLIPEDMPLSQFRELLASHVREGE
jgi:DnaJ-class molecular chaperone